MMKLNKYISWLTLSLAFAACQSDVLIVEQQEQPLESKGVYKLYGSVQKGAESRAQVVLNNTIVSEEEFIWNEGDSFTVYERQDSTNTPNVFTIDNGYNEGTPTGSAYFSSNTALTPGNAYGAIYPTRHTFDNNGARVQLELSRTVPNGRAEGWKQYFSENMFMKAFFYASEDSSAINFTQLSTLARITYTNASSEAQLVNRVEFFGPGVAYVKGVYPCLESNDYPSIGSQNDPGQMPSNWIEFQEPVEIAAGESYNFYIIFFSGSREDNYENEYQSIKIKITSIPASADCSISFETPEISASTVLGDDNSYSWVVGGRYWFNVTQTEDELTWTNNLAGKHYVKRLEFLEAIEAGNPSITFTRNDYGLVNVEENKHVFESIVSLDLSTSNGETLQLEHTDGLEYLTNLTSLNLDSVNVRSVNLSHNKKLESFSCVGSTIYSLSLGHNLKLKTVDCHGSQVSSLNFGTGSQLTSLNCSNCNLEDIWDIWDIKKCTMLQTLNCYGNKLSSLNVSENTALETLKCGNQQEETTLTLTLNDTHKSLWESTWSTYEENGNVVLAE